MFMKKSDASIARRFWSFAAIVLSLAASNSFAASFEDDVASSLGRLREVRVVSDPKLIAQYNSQMDAAWKLFSSDKGRSLPLLRAALQSELRASKPSDLLLLDAGYFVYVNDTAEGKASAMDALAHIDFRTPVVAANKRELFDFMYAVSKSHDPAILPLIEKAFLTSDDSIFVPQHALKLDGTLVCVFLYGAYGPESESVLKAKLADKVVAKRALELLVWLGTPASLPEVSRAVADSPSYDILTRVTSYMMQVAGPAGRSFMLALDSKKFDEPSKQYLAKVRAAIQETTFEKLKAGLARMPGDQQLPDDVLLARLDIMFKNYGVDDRTSPMALLNSSIPSQVLIDKLVAIRGRTLFRLSDEALSDVEVTNAALVALRYKPR